jgi:hypothetical protein
VLFAIAGDVLVDLEHLPREPVPFDLAAKVHPPRACSLSELLTASRPSDPTVGLAPLRFLHPSTTSRERAPCGAGRHPAPVPLSGFLNLSAVSRQARASRPCLVPQPFLGFLPSRVFPSQRSRTPLEAAGSLVVIHAHPGARLPGPFTTGFPRQPTLTRDRLDPPGAMSSLSAHASARFPVAPDPELRSRPAPPLHPLRSFVPSASPFAPIRVSPNRRPLLSWVSAPLELSPPTPRTLGPIHARARIPPRSESLAAHSPRL